MHVGPFEHDQSDALTEEETAAASASGTVSFVGEVDDVRPYLASATVVVLPSYREGIPRVAMEAAAMGRTVAAYDIRGMREVIDPSLGLLVARGDRRALATLVEGLLQDPDPLLRARCPVPRRGWWTASPRTRSSSGCGPPTRPWWGRRHDRPTCCLTVDVEDWYDGMAVLGEAVPPPGGCPQRPDRPGRTAGVGGRRSRR